MSRHEEFKEREKTINKIFKTLEDADMPEVVKSAIEGGKLEMLTDIADSLAIIADSLKEINARQALKDI
jgi:F0F1-type ATP synthase delta subunit